MAYVSKLDEDAFITILKLIHRGILSVGMQNKLNSTNVFATILYALFAS